MREGEGRRREERGGRREEGGERREGRERRGEEGGEREEGRGGRGEEGGGKESVSKPCSDNEGLLLQPCPQGWFQIAPCCRS